MDTILRGSHLDWNQLERVGVYGLCFRLEFIKS